jgi:3-oxoacyl-[acyl-carrier-protein] synthase III
VGVWHALTSVHCDGPLAPNAAPCYSESLGKMKNKLKAKITALGCYTPPRLLTNQDLEKLVDTNDEWIMERVGIRERHIAGPDMATSDMAIEAGKCALAQRGIAATDLSTIIVCTVTPDMFFPSTACLVQNGLGARGAWGFDLIAACSGFVYGITTGASLVASGIHKKVLVIGADTMSRIIDYTDRATCVLFGDGAGAMLIEATDEGEEEYGFIDFVGEVDGSGGDFLKMPAGGSRLPASHETVDKRMHFVHQEGQQVFKYAVRKMYEASRELLERNGLTLDDLAVMIPHQANKRIITAAADRLGIPPEKVVVNIDRYGNTTAGTIPLATRDAVCQGRLKKGDLVLFAAVGAGFTVGASLWRWAF